MINNFQINNSLGMSGIYRGLLLGSDGNLHVWVPQIHNTKEIPTDADADKFPRVQWCAYNVQSCLLNAYGNDKNVWVMFENGDSKFPVVLSYKVISSGNEKIVTGNYNFGSSNVSIDNMTSMNYSSIQNYINSVGGTPAKEWGAGTGTQCVELPKHYVEMVFGKSTKTMALGNGNEMYYTIPNAFPDIFTSIKYSNDVKLNPGDILSLVGVSIQYGHTAIVKNVSNNNVTILEQWNGSGVVVEATFSLPGTGKRKIIGIARPK